MQLQNLKTRLGNPEDVDEELLVLLLMDASDIICDIRNSDRVESKYLGTQVRIAVEFYNKMGAEGQISHNELGVDRGYERADVSTSLLRTITPVLSGPFSGVRVIL